MAGSWLQKLMGLDPASVQKRAEASLERERKEAEAALERERKEADAALDEERKKPRRRSIKN